MARHVTHAARPATLPPHPQLLLYPNPSDPLNGEAAALHMRDPAAYQRKVGGLCWVGGLPACLLARDRGWHPTPPHRLAEPWLSHLHTPPTHLQVKDYVQRFAKPEDVAALEAEEQHPHGGGDDMSDGEGDGFLSSSSDEEDEQAAGKME